MKRAKKILGKGIALGSIATLTLTSVPAWTLQAAEPQTTEPQIEDSKNLILWYDFTSLDSGTIVDDMSGHGKNGVVRPEGSGVTTEDVNIYGTDYTAYKMNGGQPSSTNSYVEMPTGILNGLEDTTISCWVYLDESGGRYQRIWDIGSDTQSYMYLIADGANQGHTGYTSALTNRGWGEEKGPQKGTPLETGKWIFTTVTFDGSEKEMSLYEDGKLIGTQKTDADLSAVQNTTQNWIGYGQFKNDILDGMVADFKIYDYAMTAEEVSDEFNIPDDQKVAKDKEWLDLGDVSAVTEDLTLPVKGAAGSDISWTSSNPDVIATDGKVTRPEAGSGDAKVTLTATITAGKESAIKTFEVTVKQKLTDKEIVEKDKEDLKLNGLGAVYENLSFPTAGAYGSTISWTSSNPDVIATDGTVTRPVGEPVTVELTATLTSGNETTEKVFEATVVPVYEKKDIVDVETVKVETSKGMAPTLPATVTVTYENDTKGQEKVVWPSDLKGEDFNTAEVTTTIEGQIVDYDVKATAEVTVTDTVSEAPKVAATEFDLSDISLDGTDTIYGQNMARDLEYLKIMDADRMLYNFRKTFGQDTKGAEPLTGWEEPTGLLRGHSTGHFMSALAQAYASTGEKAYKEKMDYMVHELRTLQEMSKGNPEDFKTQCTPEDAAQEKWSTNPEEWGEGFLSAYSPDQFALLEQYTPYATIWAPYYTLHKIMAGFIDCYTYGGNEEALEAAEGLGTWVYRRLSGCTTEEQREHMWSMYIAGEYGGMNESLARLYEITGEDKYKEAAAMFDNAAFFDGLAANEDTIQGKHANQHIPQIVGAVHEYAATGDSKYYNTAQHFWEMVTSRYAYSIGGVGTGERFTEPYTQGASILGNEGRGENCETCAAYNMLKLTQELYNYDPDNAAYMDYYERTLINQIAASQSHDTTERMHNGCTYMLPIDPGQRKDYDSDYGGFTCCNGTGMENHVKYQAAAYAKSGDTLYVNMYMPTTVNWEEKNVTVKQETKFPSENSKLTVSGSGNFTMKLRVPYWATKGFEVQVNGETICKTPEVSTYVEINRNWKDGDVVTIHMPYTLHLDKAPDKVDGSTVASIMYGPLVMVAKDDRAEYTPMNWYTLVLGDALEDTISVVTGPDSEDVPHLTTNGLDFYPMYDAYNYRYHAYVKVEDTKSVVNKEDLQALVDAVTIGEDVPDEGDYTEAQWETLQHMIIAAQNVLANPDATQADVYQAYKNLQAALEDTAVNPEPKEYTVTFVDKDGNVISAVKVKEGEAAVAPEAPQVEGYEFTGWDKDFSNVTEDMTVKALYKKISGGGDGNPGGGNGGGTNPDGQKPSGSNTTGNKNKAARTGDESNLPLAAGGVAIAGLAIAAMLKKKK